MNEDEIFDLSTINEYELLSNEDGSVLIQDNCVVIKHNETKAMKLLPLSEEVLQTLGLALVLDEDDVTQDKVQDDQAAEQEFNHEEYILDPDSFPDSEPDDADTKEKIKVKNGTLQIGFDDEEAVEQKIIIPKDENKSSISITMDDEGTEIGKIIGSGNKSDDSLGANLDGDKDPLIWSIPMVIRLLDLYEENQAKFYIGLLHKKIWQQIYDKLCSEYPELYNWTPANVQSKFAGLRRTYRGAMEYFKDNLHTTKWPFFERMHAIMEKKSEMESKFKKRLLPSTEDNGSASDLENYGLRPWRQKWTLLLLDIYQESKSESHLPHFWSTVRDKILLEEPAFVVVSTWQMYQKYLALRKLYKQHKDSSDTELREELRDRAIYERLTILDAESDTEDEQDSDCSMDSGEEQEKILKMPVRHQQRSKAIETSGAKGKAATGAKSHQMGKAAQITDIASETWSAGAISTLLQQYAATRTFLDESGPKFWAVLANRVNEKVKGVKVSPQQCEAKIQTIFLKYKSILRRDPEMKCEAKQWPLFTTMHIIFGSNMIQWPNKTLQQFLAAYQQNLARFESDEDQNVIWADISKAVNSENPQEDLVNPESCRKKMYELKEKYCKLMRDEEAAKAWPLYKRMSELFSSQLWSKTNVHILLDACADLKSRLGSDGVWARIAQRVNERSSTAAALPAQCSTELHVLRARYMVLRRKQRENPSAAAPTWPFYQRMHEIFGNNENSPEHKRPRTGHKRRRNSNEDETTYKWTDEAISRLLDLYVEHFGQLGSETGENTWDLIDQELARSDPQYSSEKNGHGAWQQYVELVTKFMDLKKRGCGSEDWPFYDRMNAILNERETVEDSNSCDSLEKLLSGESHKRTHDGSSKPSPAKRPNDTSHLKTYKRKKASTSSEWTEDDEMYLIEEYAKNKHAFETTDGPDEAVWLEIANNIKKAHNSFQFTPSQCEEKLADLMLRYEKTNDGDLKVPMVERISTRLFEKLNSVFESAATNDHINSLIYGDSEILQTLLHELKKKNELNEKRNQMLQKQHEEKMHLMKKIHDKLDKLLGDDRSDMLKLLERNLEELHK